MSREQFEIVFAAIAGVIGGVILGALLLSGIPVATLDRLATKHCQHVTDRFEFEKCKTDFLGDNK